jgi:hypothetical protein
MMHVPLTLSLLAALVAISVLLRVRWPLLSGRLRTALIRLAFAAILLQVFMYVAKWEPASDRIYRSVSWFGVAGYVFLLILWTRKSPRWLTTLSAVVLILPLLAPTLLYPLTAVFDDSPHVDAPLTGSLFAMRTPWRAIFGGTSGVDLFIYHRPHWMPFVRHGIAYVRLYNGQCNTSALSIGLSSDRTHAVVSCPPWPGKPTEQSYDLIVPLH